MENQVNNKMYGFVYLTTNNINGKKYIGQRKYHFDVTDETYLGSGVKIRRAIKKYGRENFSKIILEECQTREMLNESEIKWIAYYNAIEDEMFYNIAKGGEAVDTWTGRSDYSKRKFKKRISESNHNRVRDVSKITGDKNPAFGRHWYKDIENRKQYFLFDDDSIIKEKAIVRGMFRSKAHNRKISEAHKGKKKAYVNGVKGCVAMSKDGSVVFVEEKDIESYKQNGYTIGNTCTSKIGKVYVNNGVKNKLVDKRAVHYYIDKGYKLGRISKK